MSRSAPGCLSCSLMNRNHPINQQSLTVVYLFGGARVFLRSASSRISRAVAVRGQAAPGRSQSGKRPLSRPARLQLFFCLVFVEVSFVLPYLLQKQATSTTPHVFCSGDDGGEIVSRDGSTLVPGVSPGSSAAPGLGACRRDA
jgi:hypothetical protein